MSKPKDLLKVIAIVGPTASGKTNLAIKIAKEFSGELISVDSRQIYRKMDIGTAKEISHPHHLVNLIEPDKVFNAFKFKEMALKKIKDIVGQNKLPILVGGTGLYLDALLYNFKPKEKTRGKKLFNFIILGLKVPRKELKKIIEIRTNKMIERGLIQEVKSLVKEYGTGAYALQNTIGYAELIPYIEGKVSLEEAKREINKNTRQYAKRQMTWFKANPDIHWIENYQEAEKLVDQFIIRNAKHPV